MRIILKPNSVAEGKLLAGLAMRGKAIIQEYDVKPSRAICVALVEGKLTDVNVQYCITLMLKGLVGG